MASIQRQIHTAIITGPTGAIGMALCAKLLAEGVTVYAVTHPGSARAALLPLRLYAAAWQLYWHAWGLAWQRPGARDEAQEAGK